MDAPVGRKRARDAEEPVLPNAIRELAVAEDLKVAAHDLAEVIKRMDNEISFAYAADGDTVVVTGTPSNMTLPIQIRPLLKIIDRFRSSNAKCGLRVDFGRLASPPYDSTAYTFRMRVAIVPAAKFRPDTAGKELAPEKIAVLLWGDVDDEIRVTKTPQTTEFSLDPVPRTARVSSLLAIAPHLEARRAVLMLETLSIRLFD